MNLLPGAPAPLFDAPSPVNPSFAFGSLGGRYILLVVLPPRSDHAGTEVHAPVLIAPRILDPAFSGELIACYERQGGEFAGVIRVRDGCPLLHEATPVTRGRRYATLPFLYDDVGARVREANLHIFEDAAVA